ncbi:MAG: LysR substrate-binding domain-containing protein [Pseudomonadota bacterium]
MNERQINAFRHVMRLGSITAAARALFVSQPAVSRLISDLEADLGFPLFERRSGKLFPLPEATVLGHEVERMFYGLERLDQFAREMRGLRHGRVTIATLPMASFSVLPRVLRQFLSQHDGIRVTNNVHNSPRIADLVAAGQADIGIAQLAPARNDVRRLASWRCPCVVALPVDHALAGSSQLTPHDLAGAPMVALSHQTVTASYVTERFAEAGVTPDIRVESQPSYSACGLVAEGVGVAIVDPLTVALFPVDRVVVVPFAPTIPFDLHVVGHADRPLSRAASALVDLFIEEMRTTIGVERLAHNDIA